MLKNNKKYLISVWAEYKDKGGMSYEAKILFDDKDTAIAEYKYIKDELKQNCVLLDCRYRKVVV